MRASPVQLQSREKRDEFKQDKGHVLIAEQDEVCELAGKGDDKVVDLWGECVRGTMIGDNELCQARKFERNPHFVDMLKLNI